MSHLQLLQRNTNNVALFFLLAILQLISQRVYGQFTACSTFDGDETSCNDERNCGYNDPICSCSNPMKQDIIFLIDSSNNIDDTEFNDVKEFIENLLDYASPTTTRVGIRTFTTSDTQILSIENGTITNAKNRLSSLTRTGSTSMNAKSSVEEAQNEFNTYSTNGERRVVVTIIGGISSSAICIRDINFNDDNIYGIVVAFGYGWPKRAYKCAAKSNNNYEGFITIGNPSDLPDSEQQHAIELLICPHLPLLTITEVQPYIADDLGSVAFIEFYNHGEDIDIDQISYTGLFVGTYDRNTIILEQGTYTVIYNGQSNNYPNCTFCGCTQRASTPGAYLCDDAVYLSCGEGNGQALDWEESDASCEFYTRGQLTSNTYLTTDWEIGLTVDSYSVDYVNYVANPNNYFISIENQTGFSYELQYRGYNNQFGTSWRPSCDSLGTPGADPRTSCPNGCDVNGNSNDDICQIGGDDALCSNGVCACSANEPYYLYNDITCLPLPPPSNCSGYVEGGDKNPDYYVDIPAGWDGVWEFETTVCESPNGTNPLIQDCTFNDATRQGLPALINTIAQQGFETYGGRIGLYKKGNGNDPSATSELTNCTVETLSPTMSPTMAPTLGATRLPSCEYLVDSDKLGFTMMWEEITVQLSGAADITQIIGVVWYDEGGTAEEIITPCCSFIWDLSGDPYKLGSTYQLSPHYNRTTTAVDDADERLVAINCTEMTQEPTRAPSRQPSTLPTLAPSNIPTLTPSKAPTFGDLFIPNCIIAYRAGSRTSVTITWDLPYFDWPNTVNESQVEYFLYYDGSTQESTTTQPFITAIQDGFGYNDIIEMYVTWEPSQNADNVNRTICEQTSVSPTLAPSGIPSATPSDQPTTIPSLAPSNIPSVPPTQSPTYESPNMTWCHTRFEKAKDNLLAIVEWELIFVDNTGEETPTAEDVTYIIYDLETTNFITHDTVNENNATIGEQTVFLDLDFNVTSPKMQVTYDNGEESQIIICTYETSTPSLSPTDIPSNYPTISPTFGAVDVYLTRLTYCESDRCGCNNTKCNNYDTPIEIIRESNSKSNFFVRRSELCYYYNISISYQVQIVNKTMVKDYGFENFLFEYIENGKDSDASNSVELGEGNSTTNVSKLISSFFLPNNSYFNNDLFSDDVEGPTWNDIDENDRTGIFTMIASDECCNPNDLNPSQECERNNLIDFGIEFIEESNDLIEGSSIAGDKDGEVFIIELTGCNVNYNNSLTLDNTTCILSYPSKLFIIVEDTNSVTFKDSKTVKNNSYNEWLWWVLLGIAIFLGILSYAVYRWWVNKRMKEQDVMDIEADVDAVIEEQEQGFGNDLDKDNVNFNPLAQPLQHIKGPNDTDLNGSGNGNSGEIADRAQVRVEKFNVRQEFGPTQAAARGAPLGGGMAGGTGDTGAYV